MTSISAPSAGPSASGSSSSGAPPQPTPTPLPTPAPAPASAPTASPTLPPELDRLLRTVREQQSNVGAFSDLLAAATDYVQNGNAKASHIYCSQGRPCDFELESCMLRIFSFRAKDQVETWKNRILKAISAGCLDCYKGFLRAKDKLRFTYLNTYPTEKLDAFFGYLASCEEQIHLQVLERAQSTPGDPLRKLMRAEIYGILTLVASAHASKLADALKAVIKLEQLGNIQELPAGLLTLCVDTDASVRAFAARQMLLLKPLSPDMASLSVFQHAIQIVAKRFTDPESSTTADWSLLSILLNAAPTAAVSLMPAVLGHVHDRDPRFSDVLRAYATLLKLRGPLIWVEAGDADPEYPTVVLSGILDNPFFTNPLFQSAQTVSNPREKALFFGWMRVHLDSLKQQGGSQFSEAVKRLANFLFERMQQGHVPNECRAVAFTEAIDLVLNHADDVTSRQVVDLYATTIANLALADDAAAKTDAATRRAAQQLIIRAFDRDSRSLVRAVEALSTISMRNNQRWKNRSRAARNSKTSSQAPSPSAIYEEAAKESYPAIEICTVLWGEVYSVVERHTSREGIAILLEALAITTVYTSPSLQTHILKPPTDQANASAYESYLNNIRQSVTAVVKAFRTMRSAFAERLTDYGELAREDEAQELCTANAHSLLLLNLCPEPDIYRPAQNLLRQAFSSVETRSDCFRILFQINHHLSFRGLADYMQMFVDAANRLIEANDLAKWMVRSFADIVNVLAGSTDGILRPGTSWTLIEDRSSLQAVALKAPAIWRLMCESVAAIFKRTPQWSTLLAREEMVAWFRDVTMFASEMVDALPVFRHVVRRAAEAPSTWSSKGRGLDGEDNDATGDLEPAEEEVMVHALAMPLECATSWLRMNDEDILRETQSFVLKALDQFGVEHELPKRSKEKMLAFINEQMAIKEPSARHTLLTEDELADLKVRLDPDSGVIEISDEDDVAAETVGTVDERNSHVASTPHVSAKDVTTQPAAGSGSAASAASRSSRPEATDNSHWWSGVGRLGMLKTSPEKRKMRQAKLSFAKVDPKDIIDVDKVSERDSAKKPITLDFTRPKAPAPAPPSMPINAYRGAAARGLPSSSSSASRAGVSKGSTGKMAQLRQELGSNRSWRPSNVNVRSSDNRWGRNQDDEVTVKAPAAVSSVTGAMINRMSAASNKDSARTASKKASGGADSDTTSSSSSSSSGSDSEDGGKDREAKGLAALRAKVDRPRMLKPAQPQRRQIKVMEDPHIARARRERDAAERKRILRSPPNYAALHRSILAWNYFYKGDRPPAPSGKEPDYRRVQPLFGSVDEYGSVFGPLLLLECWAQFQQAKEEAETSSSEPNVPLEVAGRTTVDQFVDVNVTIAPDMMPPTTSYSEVDVVRLKERVPAISGKEPRIVLAKVEAFKRHPQGHQATLRCCLAEDRQGINTALVNRSKWELKKLFSLTTLHREFAALMAVYHFDLCSDILKARVAPRVLLSSSEVQRAMQGYQVNEPQARAILGSLANEGFSLIQGPPGTGKTKTICALIGAFVSNRKGPATSVQAGQAQGKVAASKKILLCAPSNAAIDEVAKRAKAGMRLLDGRMLYPKVVRVGRDDSINVSVKDVSLEYLIEQRLEGGGAAGSDRKDGAPADPSVLHHEIHSLKRQREEKQAELSAARGNATLVTQLEAEIRNLSAKRLGVMAKLDEAKDKAQSAHRQREADRRRARLEILSDADVICTTLSGAGHEMLSGVSFDFETVVIDEAAQAVELSSIIPLRYGCRQCIMVGDPNQLPPTVISQQAEKLGYSQSLFVRMFERSPASVHLLSIQYRMHPEISLFPSRTFYDSKLQDGPDMAQLTNQPWHKFELTRPFKFLATKAPESPGRMHSVMNKEEANVALALYERLRTDYPTTDFDYRIGIVTMYKAQVFELRRVFQSRYGYDIIQRIDFNTVDGFQGQEKDIIILSCVRSSNEPRSIGFLSDRRRLNVAITRAKSNLFIIGNATHLKRSDPLWNSLVTTAEACGAIQPVTVSLLQKGDRTLAKNHTSGVVKALPAASANSPGSRPVPTASAAISTPIAPSTTSAASPARGGTTTNGSLAAGAIATPSPRGMAARPPPPPSPSVLASSKVNGKGGATRGGPVTPTGAPPATAPGQTPKKRKPGGSATGGAGAYSNGNSSGRVRPPADPVGSISVGVPRKPVTPTGASGSGNAQQLVLCSSHASMSPSLPSTSKATGSSSSSSTTTTASHPAPARDNASVRAQSASSSLVTAPSHTHTHSNTSNTTGNNHNNNNNNNGSQREKPRALQVAAYRYNCQPCKQRKTKCDRVKPCASCCLRGTEDRCYAEHAHPEFLTTTTTTTTNADLPAAGAHRSDGYAHSSRSAASSPSNTSLSGRSPKKPRIEASESSISHHGGPGIYSAPASPGTHNDAIIRQQIATLRATIDQLEASLRLPSTSSTSSLNAASSSPSTSLPHDIHCSARLSEQGTLTWSDVRNHFPSQHETQVILTYFLRRVAYVMAPVQEKLIWNAWKDLVSGTNGGISRPMVGSLLVCIAATSFLIPEERETMLKLSAPMAPQREAWLTSAFAIARGGAGASDGWQHYSRTIADASLDRLSFDALAMRLFSLIGDMEVAYQINGEGLRRAIRQGIFDESKPSSIQCPAGLTENDVVQFKRRIAHTLLMTERWSCLYTNRPPMIEQDADALPPPETGYWLIYEEYSLRLSKFASKMRLLPAAVANLTNLFPAQHQSHQHPPLPPDWRRQQSQADRAAVDMILDMDRGLCSVYDHDRPDPMYNGRSARQVLDLVMPLRHRNYDGMDTEQICQLEQEFALALIMSSSCLSLRCQALSSLMFLPRLPDPALRYKAVGVARSLLELLPAISVMASSTHIPFCSAWISRHLFVACTVLSVPILGQIDPGYDLGGAGTGTNCAGRTGKVGPPPPSSAAADSAEGGGGGGAVNEPVRDFQPSALQRQHFAFPPPPAAAPSAGSSSTAASGSGRGGAAATATATATATVDLDWFSSRLLETAELFGHLAKRGDQTAAINTKLIQALLNSRVELRDRVLAKVSQRQ
ncbi:hypothetical protein BCV70DRAFT_161805, partial [Testicularia cyperi]